MFINNNRNNGGRGVSSGKRRRTGGAYGRHTQHTQSSTSTSDSDRGPLKRKPNLTHHAYDKADLGGASDGDDLEADWRDYSTEVGASANDERTQRAGDESGSGSSRDAYRRRQKEEDETTDAQFGFERFTHGQSRRGWLINLRPTSVTDEEDATTGESAEGSAPTVGGPEKSAVDMYFIEQDGSTFKAALKYEPYFYIGIKDNTEMAVEGILMRHYEDLIASITLVEKHDLDMPNHLSGKKAKYLRVSFHNVQNLIALRKVILPLVEKNKQKLASMEVYHFMEDDESNAFDDNDDSFLNNTDDDEDDDNYGNYSFRRRNRASRTVASKGVDYTECIVDIREYDVKYHVRLAIDLDIRVGCWYDVSNVDGRIHFHRRSDLVERANPRVCAFDIETTKAPLMFPKPETDSVMMISYMIDGQGFLIVNRHVVSEDIGDFEYTPRPGYDGPFTVLNVPDEKSLLRKWFDHVREVRPSVMVTYNGDWFDFGFIEHRAKHHGMNMRKEIGYYRDNANDIYRSTYGIHMDCLYWVKRDSYLPQGSHGLKMVTKAKLGYNPAEVDPEDMMTFAKERPQILATYSVSDAVATYYLYMKYVHPFIFSLCTVIPMPPDEVLRKGSGTLCESLLMVSANDAKVIAPNRHHQDPEKMYKGHPLESETYIGGHVEALRSGIYRADLPVKFDLTPKTYQTLIDDIDHALHFTLTVENKTPVEDVTNYDEVRNAIISQLEALRDQPKRIERPMIYHLDVGAMYPNIITTNRLQPTAIVDESTCASCVHNKPGSDCQRKMDWHYRAEYFKSTASEYRNVKAQLMSEKFPVPSNFRNCPQQQLRTFDQLPRDEQRSLIKKRLSEYTRKVYKKIYEKESEIRQATICQRENPFYVNTVRTFRDRRYEYKAELKNWREKLRRAQEEGHAEKIKKAKDMIVVYDSMQVAHKVVLNSFYGYVMRKGARWYSIEMAGVVTYSGAQIIKMARELVDGIGITLELDTDGIWCMLPSSFPENFEFTTKERRKIRITYPCVMLNADVNAQFTNNQYQDLVDEERMLYHKRSECSIFFEVDGPYRAMILPASKEEGKGIKKRYIVFDHDGTIAELKGFEIKRRGELKLIKLFQSRLFESFLNGQTLEHAYDAVGAVANQWLDILFSRGEDVEDEELFELLTESSNMSKTIEEYGKQKSARITTARRLAELFGEDMIRDKGLVCSYVVSRKPEDAPVSERVIPVKVFQMERAICAKFLKKWTKDSSINDINIRDIIDWNYYIERLGSAIQKIITIPAALQGIDNPVSRIGHPEWLKRQLRERNDSRKQRSILSMMGNRKDIEADGNYDDADKENRQDVAANVMDIENLGMSLSTTKPRKRKHEDLTPSDEEENDEREKQRQQETIRLRQESRAVRRVQKLISNPQRSVNDALNNKDFSLWLAAQKSCWKKKREAKRKLRAGEAMTDRDLSDLNTLRPTTIGGYMRQQTLMLQQHDWHIVQLRETDIPGIMRLFFVVNNIIHNLLLKVPRVVYVNMKEPISDNNKHNLVKRDLVRRVLPRDRPSFYLYREEMPEEMYQTHPKDLHALFLNPNMQGVYEGHVPLVFRACLKLGNVCTLARKSWDKLGTNEPLSIDDLLRKMEGEDRSTQLSPYLTTADALHHVFLYHNMADNRGIMGLFIFSSARARIYVIQPFSQADKPNINWERLLHEAFCHYIRSNQQLNDDTADLTDEEIAEKFEQRQERNFKFDMEFVANKKEAQLLVQRDLEGYHNERKRPSVVMLHSSTRTPELYRSIPALNDFPVLTMPTNEDDFRYPALQWIQFSTRRMTERLWNVKEFYNNALEYARYAKVPLGNFEPDVHSHSIDLLFGRKLTQQNHLLWVSLSSRPDLGGSEKDDNLIATVDSNEIDGKFEISRPGMHHTVCVELDVNYLVINSIIQSRHINDVLGGGGGGGDGLGGTSADLKGGPMFGGKHEDGESHMNKKKAAREINAMTLGALGLYDESILCGRSFEVLKLLVSEWFKDVGDNQSEIADSLISHLYRWLRNSNSKLYDPALFRLVQKLMKRVFFHLLSQLRKLGSKIVYANFNRIIIATAKNTLEDAQSYVDFIIQTLHKQSVFAYIGLEPVKFWDHLLWVDSANFSGILVHSLDDVTTSVHGSGIEVSESLSQQTQSSEFGGSQLSQSQLSQSQLSQSQLSQSQLSQSQQQPRRKKRIQLQWNIAQMFPHTDITRDFQQVIKIYLSKLYSEKHAFMKSMTVESGKEMIREDELNKHMEAFAKDLITSHCTPHLLERLPIIKQIASTEHSSLPKIISARSGGSEERNHALEFTNSICHILSHDRIINDEVLQMKRGMLKLLHVREFSGEARFINRNHTFKLPDVICATCNTCRNLDLCRDPDLLASSTMNSTANGSGSGSDATSSANAARPTWRCSCGAPYDMNIIESRLVEHVERNVVAYQLQDLQCVKCQQVKMGSLAVHCECSGAFACQQSDQHIKRTLSTLHEIAKFYRFEWLEQVVSLVL